MTVNLSELKIGQPVRYLVGTRNGKTATVSDISKSPISIKNTYTVTLTFDDESLPPHLLTQPLTAYNGIVEGCEIDF